MEKDKKYLSLGSVVILKNGTKTVMIYGRKQLDTKTKTEFDYVACLFPEGNISRDYTFMFNHSDVKEVLFEGFSNDDDKKFVEKLIKS